MQYYKKIEVDYYDAIVEKTLDFIKTKTDHLDKSKYKGPFINLSHWDFIKHVPEINWAFHKYGLFFEDANIFLMWDNRDCLPHKDYTDSIARVNFPILNCQGTRTVFYENLKSKRLILPTGAPFYMTMNKDYVEVDSVEMTQATIVRISEGHSVIMNEEKFPRITLTLSFTPDVGLLLDN
jgi:hypothetical protein